MALGGDGSSVRDLLEDDRLGELSGIDAGGGVALDDGRAAAPVPDPEKIVCIGLNYRPTPLRRASIAGPQRIFGSTATPWCGRRPRSGSRPQRQVD